MRWSSYRRWTLQKYSPLSCFPSCPAIRFTASCSRFAWAVPFGWSCAGLALDGVRGDAGDVHGRRARALASTRLCLDAQAAPSSASCSQFAWSVPFLWSSVGLGCGGARGDAGDVHGRHARTLACSCMRRSSLHSPSHGSSHPPADACFDASFSIACWHLAMLVCFPCRLKLLRRPRNVPPKAESVDGEHARQPSRVKPRLHRLRPIRTCTAVDPAQLAVGHATLHSNRGGESQEQG
jgi:hypothetical protein